MVQLRPHLTFHGLCRDALQFYQQAFGGEVSLLRTFDDSPVEFPDHLLTRVMHAEFDAPGVSFMASDGMDDSLSQGSGDISFQIYFETEHRQNEVFGVLADEGQIVMPLDYTFWNVRFGIVTDKFGIRWMLSCPADELARAPD